MQPCPKCQSQETGLIQASDGFSFERDVFVQKRIMKRGYLIKHVTPSDYRDYYLKFEINAFCDSCGYEFQGTLREVEISNEDLEEYESEHGISRTRALYEKIPKTKWITSVFSKIGESLGAIKKKTE